MSENDDQLFETEPQGKRGKRAVKEQPLTLFLWRSRQRGYLAVVAHDLEEARVVAVQHQPNLQNFVTRQPEAILPVEAGQVAYLKQRL